MQTSIASYQWVEEKKIQVSEIIAILLAPQIICLFMYILGIFKSNIELSIIALFSSIVTIVSTYFLRKPICYQIEITEDKVNVRILEQSNKFGTKLKNVESIAHGKLIQRVNIESSFGAESLVSITISKKRDKLILIIMNERKIELNIGELREQDLAEIISRLKSRIEETNVIDN